MNHLKYDRKISNKNNSTVYLLMWLLCIVGLASCVKQEALYSPQEGTIYVPLAYSDRATLSLFKIDTAQTTYFGIAYGGFKTASTEITANFKVDTSLIAQYNIDNAYLGNQYVALPDSAYAISSLSTILKAGATSSDPIGLSVMANKLSSGKHYLLPVKLTDISSGKIDSSLAVVYFKIDTLVIRFNDVTKPSTLTVSQENGNGASANEGSPKLVDGDYTTKFLSSYDPTNYWMQLKLGSAQKINAYAITSGNDAPERDPKDWKLQASDDGTTWKTLDERSGYIFGGRQQTVSFELNEPDGLEHLYYRWLVTANGGAGLIQITEWRLQQYY